MATVNDKVYADLNTIYQKDIRMARRCAGDEIGLVGLLDVQRVRVDGRVHRDRADREAPASAHHAASDLAAVGDEDLAEHQNGPLVLPIVSWRHNWPLPT